ncbi:Universal stress protein A [Corchorus olitorius]|uniref:Universal stress protein A n=1 Tax=Corchorus olitorius TaxID=93759 RepID=A0A1R3KS13_9ROSI|nr:Universal stress protein A [Corchorus olitorius]
MEENKRKKKMMVAIDESECSYYALQWALENLGDTLSASASHLFIFNAQPLPNLAYLSASTYGVTPLDLIKTLQENQNNFSLALLEKAKDICSNHGVKAETMTEVGDPKERICEAVERLDIQLLILGSNGRGALQRAFLGSVSNYCVHNAKCPVLVVRKSA